VLLPRPHDTPDLQLEAAYRELYPLLLRFAHGMVGSRADAEEAVHDAFCAAAASPTPPRDLRPWLFRVTRNAAITVIRRRRGLVALDAAATTAAVAPLPADAADTAADLDLMWAGVDRLPERSRAALMLRELAGFRYGEIAEVLGVSEANVKVLIFRARRTLHDLMDATRMACDAAQTALSAASDGEAGKAELVRARLHSAHCARCSSFASSVTRQRSALGALVPLAVGSNGPVLAVAAAHGAAGGKAGGILGAKLLVAGLVATTVTAGGVAAWHERAVLDHRSGPGINRPAPAHSVRAHHHNTAVHPTGTATTWATGSRMVPPAESRDEGAATTPGGGETAVEPGDGSTSSAPAGSDGAETTTASPTPTSTDTGGTETESGGTSSTTTTTTTSGGTERDRG
jgi:RNA polymerase sigma-70 factor (ECF subfamily)